MFGYATVIRELFEKIPLLKENQRLCNNIFSAASRKGHQEAVHELLRQVPSLAKEIDRWRGPLFEAKRNGYLAIAEMIEETVQQKSRVDAGASSISFTKSD